MREDARARGVQWCLVPRRAPASDRPRHPSTEDPPVLDLVYIAGAIVLFALVGLVGRGVEKL
jgi:hypothetical protein